MHRIALNASRYQARATCPTAVRARPVILRRLPYSTQTQTPKHSEDGTSTNGAPRNTDTDLPPELENVGIPPTNFAKPTLTALNFWYRLAKFSLIGIAVAGGTALVGLEGTHLWIERVELAAPNDPDGELERWGWTKDVERWTGSGGGTDPALGSKARHALRSAWIIEHWGTGAEVISPHTLVQAQQSPERAIEARLEYAHDFLVLALALATEDANAGRELRKETLNEIRTRKAAVLERIGSKGALYDARATYERIWDDRLKLGTAAEADNEERARLALKLGDVNARLGDAEEAREWWARALRIASSSSSLITGKEDARLGLELPARLPSSPHAQRTIAATLSSLSAYLAQSGRLADAKTVEDAGIALLSSSSSSAPSLSKPSNLAETDNKSAPRKSHDLFLQHRVSLLALHRAEVTHALESSRSSSSPEGTLEELAKAAIEAEDIIFGLTSPPSPSPSSSYNSPPPTLVSDSPAPSLLPSAATQTSPGSGLLDTERQTPAHKATLDPTYTKNAALKTPASGLLRDARRTAVHAWTLSGILHENNAAAASSSSSSASSSSSTSEKSSWRNLLSSPSSSEAQVEKRRDAEYKAALRCYTRALAWAGASTSTSSSAYTSPSQVTGPGEVGEVVPSREMLDSEWRALWEGYTRTRDAVLASAAASSGDEDVKGGDEIKKGR